MDLLYLSGHSRDTLEEIENYYLLDFSHANPWHDFENALGAFEWSEFYDAHNELDPDDDDFRPSFVFGLEDDFVEQTGQHVDAIKNYFQEWVSSIDTTKVDRKLNLRRNSVFVTFNYTSTLQSVYKIDEDRVLHIHGRAEAYDDLIFGHGETMEEEQELDANGDSNRIMFSDAQTAAKYPFYALKKLVEESSDKLQAFINNKEDIDEIVIVGHSLNKIDLQYFQLINDRLSNAIWKCS